MTDGVVSVEKLSLLFELSSAFTAQIELQELLPLIMAQTQGALGAENCSLLLLDEVKQELFFPVTSDVRPEVGAQLQEIRFPANRGIAVRKAEGRAHAHGRRRDYHRGDDRLPSVAGPASEPRHGR